MCLNNNSSKSTQSNGRSNFSVFLISRSVDVLDLKVNVSVLKNKGITLANIHDIIHQIYCFNILTNVLKRAALIVIGDVNTTYDRDSIRYKSTNLH